MSTMHKKSKSWSSIHFKSSLLSPFIRNSANSHFHSSTSSLKPSTQNASTTWNESQKSDLENVQTSFKSDSSLKRVRFRDDLEQIHEYKTWKKALKRYRKEKEDSEKTFSIGSLSLESSVTSNSVYFNKDIDN